MIVDTFTLLGESIFGQSSTRDELLRAMDQAEIDRAVVCPARPRGYHLGPANDALATSIADDGDRLTGFARVDPHQGDAAAAEARRALGELGLAGVFLHPWEETFRISARDVDAVVDVARAASVPVLIAAGYPWLSEGLQIGELASRFDEVTFIATNGGQLNISGLGQTDIELAMSRCPNLYLQTAGVYREDFLENVVARFGSERLLFASGFPVMDPRLEVQRPRSMHVDALTQDAVLGDTAARLLGLE
ncbi:MAG: amidohydrolase family protein [Gaiellaceae bacterium]